MFPLFETIKTVDGNLKNLDFHEKRFRYSFHKFYGKPPGYKLKEVIRVPDNFNTGLVKTRFRYNNKNFNIEYSFYKARKINTLKIVHSNDIKYSMKFTDRNQINRLFELRENSDDILIVKNGFFTDTSICNVLFFKNGKWFTPGNPLLKGTCRERLLLEKKIIEKKIHVNDLQSFENFALINAMIWSDKFKPIPIKNIHY